MLDIKWMRENRTALAEAMEKLNDTTAPWQEALTLDEQRRQLLTQVETLRAERNSGSKRVGELFREKKADDANFLKVRMTTIGGEIEAIEVQLRVASSTAAHSPMSRFSGKGGMGSMETKLSIRISSWRWGVGISKRWIRLAR